MEAINCDVAWNRLLVADGERDLTEFKEAFIHYCKSAPNVSFPDIQNILREHKMNTWLVAREQVIPDTYTSVNSQGKTDCKYVLSFQFGLTPRRKKTSESWPKTVEENFERLADAGFVMDAHVVKCSNCLSNSSRCSSFADRH